MLAFMVGLGQYLLQYAYLVSGSHTRFQRLDLVADLHNYTCTLMTSAFCSKH